MNQSLPGTQPTTVIQPKNIQRTNIYRGAKCPNCEYGTLKTHFGFWAVFLAIIFFPIGIACCIGMRDTKCDQCSLVF